ncbi:MAG: sigma-54-dependent Fis family transcriptional regulator [Deltaproteobacteria bacterium]|nr:sigma-54-dependent Fis family transcriptional regulator [Deltaproteobacteria bacterium]
MTRILVVDDDRALRHALKKALTRKGCDVDEVPDGEHALQPLMEGKSDRGLLDVCVLDLRMPGLSGIDVLRRTQGRRVPVVVLTGHGSIEDAVQAMRYGACNFVQKPVDADELWPVLEQAMKEKQRGGQHEIIARSDAMMQFLEQVDRAARSDEAVLLLGETGSGKELAARRLHKKSTRSKGPFVAINAACVPRELFESEIFGHKKGSFTGAHQDREGLLAKAAGGTLFIDEVGDLPLEAQAKLLRALEERSFRPVGADSERPFEARIVAATHRNLVQLVEEKGFRSDLYYRLSVLPLLLPPLRERGRDVLAIATAWMHTMDTPLTLSEDAEELLLGYAFPGNVRELVNILKRALILMDEDAVHITSRHLAQFLRTSPFAKSTTSSAGSSTGSAATQNGISTGPQVGEHVTLEDLEKTHIRHLLEELHNVSEVARIVGIDRRTLQRKMINWGLRDE